MKNAIKKSTLAVYSATALAALTIGLAAPAMAAPAVTQYGGVPQDCSVHVNYQGSDVDVNWC
jgi:predicted S18 family serine protease